MTQSATELHAEVVHFIAHYLRTMLPPPLDGSEPERERTVRAAAALIGELKPATIAEAEQAVICVAASAHGLDSFRLAGDPGNSVNLTHKCRAQAASMFRCSDLARRQLAKLQAARQAVAEPTQAAAPAPPQAASSAPVPPDTALVEAEAFARQSPRRAIQIRRLGRVPAGIGYKAPRPEVVHALVTGRSPALLKLDRKVA